MSRIEVAPLPDGVDQRVSWQVKKDGSRLDTFTIKRTARKRARQAARKGDTLTIKGTNGQILDSKTYQGSAGGSNEQDKDSPSVQPYGLETFKTGISDAFQR